MAKDQLGQTEADDHQTISTTDTRKNIDRQNPKDIPREFTHQVVPPYLRSVCDLKEGHGYKVEDMKLIQQLSNHGKLVVAAK